MLADQKNSSNSWWESYDEATERMSDYWMEISRGKFHVVGQEIHKMLPHDNEWYESNGGTAKAMDDLYDLLSNDPSINWTLYDKWSKVGNSFVYSPQGDGFIDMIYFVFRSQTSVVGVPNARMSDCVHGDHVIYDNGSGIVKKLRSAYSEYGSGLQIAGFQDAINLQYAVSFIGHEHGHYLLGVRDDDWHAGHQGYGKVNNYFGMEEFYSPYELIRTGYFQTKKITNWGTNDYTLLDWTTRNYENYSNPDEILEVPIGDANRNEFFLIVNRQKMSTYDIIMWGDDAHSDPYNNETGVKGNGIYIYHAYPGAFGSGYQWQVPFDQECADGLWDWEYVNDIYPDWSCRQLVPYYRRTDPIFYLNDFSEFNILGQSNGLQIKDGKSMNHHWNDNGTMTIHKSWFGLGFSPGCESGFGNDRIETNLILNAPYSYQYPYNVWTSREHQGDRWDAWNVDYNEVFSPYSSPSTSDFNSQNSSIFIFLESMIDGQANFKIYKAGAAGLTEDYILSVTPPSKPMNLKNEFCFLSSTYPFYYYNKLTWNHNLEPDMRRPNGEGGFLKRYRVYKVSSANMSDLPDENNYTLISTVDINETVQPSFVDYSEPSGCNEPPDGPCPPICWVLHAVRYRVEAVDIHDDVSVKSDFASGSAYNVNQGGRDPGDNPFIVPKNIPGEFSLLQNYPNPFNPSTEIKFELPQNTFVTLKVYNALGQVVAELVNNEYRNAGRYSVSFDGTKFASGIYFYSIEAGSYNEVKKMVLLK